jgi:tetratricopeptide (TPR) repeat protein
MAPSASAPGRSACKRSGPRRGCAASCGKDLSHRKRSHLKSCKPVLPEVRIRRICFSVVALLLIAAAPPSFAQPGATGPVADLNAQAKALSDTEPDKSLAIAVKALAAARDARDVRGEAEALNYIAYGYRAQSLLDMARQSGLESVRLYREAGDEWGQAQGYNTLGLIEADAGKFPEALEYHLRALEIRRKTGDKEGLAYTFNNLGNTYRNMGAFEQAIDFHEQGLKLKVELGLKSSEAFSHHNIGLVHFAKKDYARAVAAYRRGMAIREQLNDPRGIAVSLNAIGQVEALNDPAAALRTYQRALALRRQTGDQRGEMATEINLSDLHRRTGDYAQASAALNRALAIGAKLEAPLMYSNALKGLADLEAARGNFAAAYKHHIAYHQARERMFNEESNERFQKLRLAQEAQQQQQQIQLLEQQGALRDAELSRARTMRTALGVTAVLGIISVALVYARLRLQQQVKTLRGLLPICAWCKKIRDDNGAWTQFESYLSRKGDANFTHCICPVCAETMGSESTTARV